MPQLDVTTKSAEQVWASPDGQRVLYEVVMEWEGKPVKAKTYSQAIATENWTGTVVTEERPNKKGGVETFVKQPQKEGGYSGGGGYRGGGGGGRAPADPFTMYMSYAKDLVVAQVAAGAKLTLDDSVAATISNANLLYESRPDATPASSEKPAEKPAEPDVVHDVDPEEPIDLSEIDKVFPGNEKVGG
jgi:hypothetical protein